jgi:hypothetical protein
VVSICPSTSDALLVRTDFSNQQDWEVLLTAALAENEDGFRAFVEVIDDASLAGLDPMGVRSALPDGYEQSFVIVADRVSLTSPDRALLVIDLVDDPGRTFRVVPAELWGVDNNLSISNMFLSEFADSVDPDGVFRGFPEPP